MTPTDPTRPDHHAHARLLERHRMHEEAARTVAAQRVRDPRGGLVTVENALSRMDELRHRIDVDERAGSRAHDRISRLQRILLRLLPPLDGVILFWFLTGVLNADLRTVDATVVIAAALALLCTVGVAAWTAAVGEHMQRYKDPGRNVVWPLVDGLARGMLVLTAIMAALLATMMYLRVEDEVYQSTGAPGPTATIIAATLATAVATVNLYVLYLSFTDGSALTRELDRLAGVLAPHLRRRDQRTARAGVADGRIRVWAAATQQLAGPGRTETPRALATGEAPEATGRGSG